MTQKKTQKANKKPRGDYLKGKRLSLMLMQNTFNGS